MLYLALIDIELRMLFLILRERDRELLVLQEIPLRNFSFSGSEGWVDDLCSYEGVGGWMNEGDCMSFSWSLAPLQFVPLCFPIFGKYHAISPSMKNRNHYAIQEMGNHCLMGSC